MRLIYPLGLLGLIAIPILIIIYIIKNKYVEQVVPSTYLWTLSEKFLKRRNPIRMITGIISLILQILAVILVSVSIAHPVFTLANAANDYCFILDGSASMNMVQERDNTRFDLAKRAIRDEISKSATGSAYTLVYVGESTDIIFDGTEDKRNALSLLNDLTPTDCSEGFVAALSEAQERFNANPSLKVYVVTDKAYDETENVTVVNVAETVRNYAVDSIEHTISGGKLIVSGKAYSYTGDADISLSLFVDESDTADGEITVSVRENEPTDFSFESDALEFQSLCVRVNNSDSFKADNEARVYNVRYDRSFDTLIVSENPFFLRAMFTSLGNAKVTAVTPEEYEAGSIGARYGLYIYDCYTPETLPRNGAVWFIKPGNVADSGFSARTEIHLTGSDIDPDRRVLNFNNSTRPEIRNVVEGVTQARLGVASYVDCRPYGSFLTIATIDGRNPAILIGTNNYRNREVVFTFGLTDSDFVMSHNFIILLNNLIRYTFPTVIDDSLYACGDTVNIAVLSNCDSVRLQTPSGEVLYLDETADSVQYTPDEAGVYTVTETMGSEIRRANFFVSIAPSERLTSVRETSITLSGEQSNERRDGRYEDLLVFFIILAVVFVADWMVYCYEQYQLR